MEAKKIVEIHGKTNNYTIPLHEFSKAAILGDYSHFYPDSSLAMNLFDVQTADRKEHFLCLMIVSFLHADASHKNPDGFAQTAAIVSEMQAWGFLPDQTDKALRRLTNKRLIETTERITFEEDLAGLIGEMPEGFRATPIGIYHLQRWAGDFAYLDGMVFDTPVFEPSVREELSAKPESFDITDRYARSLTFRNYLCATWDASPLRPSYFDWNEVTRYGQRSFDGVRRAIDRNAVEQRSNGQRPGRGPYQTGKTVR